VHKLAHSLGKIRTDILSHERFKLLLPEGPNANDSEAIIRTHAFERGVLALPGAVFIPGGHKTSYVRAAFSLLEPDQVEEACKRLAATLREIQ
jgi:tryptophan aminotransferase